MENHLRNEIAWLEYGKDYCDLTPGEQNEVDYQVNDMIELMG